MIAPDPSRCPTYPGEILREDVLPVVMQPVSRIARGLGVSRQHLHATLAETRSVSAKVAVRLIAMFGGSAEVWLRMQAAHDVWHATRSLDVSE